MAKKFINWDNLEYIIESMQKFLIDHNGLDNHLDVFWEARERVTDNMKYGRDITGCTYTKEQYESLINPETSPYLEGTFVGVAEKNKSQDTWLSSHDAWLRSHDGWLGSHDAWLTAIEAKNESQDSRMTIIEEENAKQDTAISSKANASDVYTKSQTDSEIAKAKKSILTGESTEQLNESYDTLLEIHKWIVSHGKDAADLLEAITSLSSRVEEIEKNGVGGNVDPNTTAKINDLRRVLDEIANVEWNAEVWDNISKPQLTTPNLIVASKTTNSITIEWDDVVGANLYEVSIQSLDDGYAYNDNQTVEFGTNTCTFTACDPGIEYGISIKAIDTTNNYDESDICNITTSTYVMKLASPDISLNALSNTSVHINWHRVPNATSYKIELVDEHNRVDGDINVNGDVFDCIFDDMVLGKHYAINALAQDETGKCEESELVSIDFTLTKLDAPQVGLIGNGDTVTLSWFKVENAEGYNIVQNGLDVGTFAGTSYTFTNLEPSTKYVFGVQAMAGGPYVYSDVTTVEYTCPEAEIPTITKLAVPVFNITNITDNSLDLDWEAVPFAKRYKIYIGGEYLDTTDQTSYTITGLTPETRYVIGMQSIDDDREYEDSDVYNVEAMTISEYSGEVTGESTGDVTEESTSDVTEESTSDVTEDVTEDITEESTQLGKPKLTPVVSYFTSADSINLTFEHNEDIEKYTIRVGELSAQTSSNEYTIPNLNPNTMYTVIVEATPKYPDMYEGGSVVLKITTIDNVNNDVTGDIGDVTKLTFEGGELTDPNGNLNNTLAEALENA